MAWEAVGEGRCRASGPGGRSARRRARPPRRENGGRTEVRRPPRGAGAPFDLGGERGDRPRGPRGRRRTRRGGRGLPYRGDTRASRGSARLLLHVFLLYSALGSARNALLVLVNLPFALVGGVVGAVVFGMPLSVSAAVAFIVLLGIAVQNGVVLLSFFRQLRERGLAAREAVVEGCRVRLKPLVMTALTSFIGHLPMVYATGAGADIQKPLAVVVMGGIVTSTLLTLLVLPVLYESVERRSEAVR